MNTTNPKPNRRRKSKSSGRKSRQKPRADDNPYYAIKDIIDEKLENDRLWYRVDWEDDPDTHQTFDPTWEPAEYVTEEAIAAWEDLHRTVEDDPASADYAATGPPFSSVTNSQPVLPPNWRAQHSKRTREEGFEHSGRAAAPEKKKRRVEPPPPDSDALDPTQGDTSWSFAATPPEKRGTLIVGVPAQPHFNPAEYAAVLLSSSQIQPSQNPSSPPRLQESEPVSQKTIPDSQDFSESLPSTTATKQPHLGDILELNATQEQSEPSGETIPSRQPDNPPSAAPTCQTLLETDQAGLADTNLDFPSAAPSEFIGRASPQHTGTDPSSHLGFRSQPDFGLDIPPLGDSSPKSPGHRTIKPASSGDVSGRTVIPDTSPHSAQVVRALNSHPRGIRTQSQDDQEYINIYDNEIHTTSAAEQRSQNFQRSPATSRPSTSSSNNMDRSPLGSGSPLRAVERFRKLQAELYANPPTAPDGSSPSHGVGASGASAVPSPVSPSPAAQPQPTAAPNADGPASGGHPEEQQSRQVGQTPASTASHMTEMTASTGDILDRLASAVDDMSAPAPPVVPLSDGGDIFNEQSMQPPAAGPTSDELGDAVLPGIESQGSPEEMDPDALLPSITRPVSSGVNRYVVTLPMPASTRPQYLAAIRANKSTMTDYGTYFTTETPEVPDSALVSKIEAAFQQLFDLCDMPAFFETLPDMAPEAKKRHATGTNSKFSFVYELLEQLRDSNARVLLVARPDRVLEYLDAVVSTSGFAYGYLDQETTSEGIPEGLRVTLAGTDQDLSGVETAFDVVILFDHFARSIELPRNFISDDPEGPIILSLVVTASIEHIDLRLTEDLDPLERKNAVSFALALSRDGIQEPRYILQEPHQIAMRFADFIIDPSQELDWEPQGIPDDWFEVYGNTQIPQKEPLGDIGGQVTDSARSGSRKRLLDDVEEGTPKRTRITGTQEPASSTRTPPLMSDLLKKTLTGGEMGAKTPGPSVEISVQRLEAMAAEIAALSAQVKDKATIEMKLAEHVKSLEEQLKSNEKTIRDIQPKYMEALRDRGVFEQERDQAVAESKRMEARLGAAKANSVSVEEENAVLKAKLDASTTLLGQSMNPDVAQFVATGKELQEAKAKVEALEKKLASSKKDLDYSRDAYQNASTSASEIGIENRELKERIQELEKVAGDNLTRAQQIQSQNESRETLRELDELKAIVKERERELDRLREEVRQLRNGRRETRHPSVPRSPRLGVMSPRVSRSAGGGAHSRGTSPSSYGGPDAGAAAAGMTFFNQVPGGGRWDHLRD